jgi:type I restriction enzyme R subunit
MSELRISEAGTVQFPMVRHAHEIGWTPIAPDVAKQKRGGEAGMLLRDELEAKLAEFNPWLTIEAIHAIIETLDAVPPTIEGNREMLAWLRGEKAWHDEAEKRHRRVTVIDFEHTDANIFDVSWEWVLKPPARKGNRADVMFLVNGLPVCIVEHKNPKDGDAIERGITQLRRYEKETPELVGAPQLFNVTHLLDYWYGVTWNVTRRDMARWKQTRDEAYRFAVQAFFERTDFLRTLQHWILFYVKDSETKKSVLRQHQRRAIDAIIARCSDRKRKRGLIWHTQGSGKTFTLLTAARLILEEKARFHNATVILVVDRTELDGQLKGWVERLLGEMKALDIATERADSKAKLQSLLDSRADRLDDPQVRGNPQKQLHARQCLRLYRRGASLGCQGPRHLFDGRRAERHDHRIYRNPDCQNSPGRGHVQDFRRGRRAWLPRQILDRGVDRRRNDHPDQAYARTEHDDGSSRTARQGVLRAGGIRGRHRCRGAEQSARPGGRAAHIPDRR